MSKLTKTCNRAPEVYPTKALAMRAADAWRGGWTIEPVGVRDVHQPWRVVFDAALTPNPEGAEQ